MLSSLIAPIAGLLDKFIPDTDKKNEIAYQLATMAETYAHEVAKGQLTVNAVEAAHKSMFVAGWRPAIGWVCVLAMFGNYFIIPIVNFALAIGGSILVIELIQTAEMLPVLMGILGLGAMRTTEKLKGVQREK